MTKLSKADLNKIFSLAKQNLVDLPSNGLDSTEFVTECWIRAIDTCLGVRTEIEWPKRVFPEPED